MPATATRGALFAAFSLACFAALSCKSARDTRPYLDPPPPDIRPEVIEYAETDAFDVALESLLVAQAPVIVVETHTPQPDWGGRLNAWVAAWNRGGRVAGTVRFQAPLSPFVINGESIREFRLLIESLMDRVEDLARDGSAWWAEEKTRSRRVALLKPYNLRFHLDEDKNIQLIFFNGRYSEFYDQHLRALSPTDAEPREWTRAFRCSRCRRFRPFLHAAWPADAP